MSYCGAHRITEQRDTLGRSTGYVYAKNDIPQQQTTIGYSADGRVANAGFTHQGEQKVFTYAYLPGTHLLHTLAHPNGLTLTQSYDATRDLPTDMSYSRADALVVQRSYDYDLLGRPTARNLARYGTETQDTFGYNTRSESPRGLGGGLDNARSGIAPKGRVGNGVPASQFTTARVNSADYSYAYNAIGNRTSATEVGTRTAYTANKLNQYTAEGSFRPTFDADGNQTLIKTSTGTWNVTYNAKNRPVLFAKSDGSVTVECTYDTMGRRATKKVTTNGSVTEHRRFLYRGYLQIACCDLTRAYTPALWFITWESPRRLGGGLDKHEVFAPKGRAGNGVPASQPTQDTATRPLAIQKNGTWYTYGWDLTKNICETYRTDARIDLAYTYTPYGEVSPAHAYDQPLRWSSEYHDVELGLHYYNYRHYNPAMGRWMRRDDCFDDNNFYKTSNNNPFHSLDILGHLTMELIKTHPYFFTSSRGVSFSFGWKFKLDKIYDFDVYIVQKIEFLYDIQADIMNADSHHKEKGTYFEAWEVMQGFNSPAPFTVNGFFINDHWWYKRDNHDAEGIINVHSTAIVYSKHRIGSLDYWGTSVKKAHNLLSTYVTPAWWKHKAITGEKVQDVEMYIDINNLSICPENEHRKITIIKNGSVLVNEKH